MKNDLVAVILFFIICSSVSTAYADCSKVFGETLTKCSRRDPDSFVEVKGPQKYYVNPKCCGLVIKQLQEACDPPPATIADSVRVILGLMMDSCGQHQAPPIPSPSPSTPTPTPTPPPPSSSSSTFEPPALQLPEVSGRRTGRGGCWLGSGRSDHCWSGVNNVPKTCCVLKRYKGIRCDNGEPFDVVKEMCCVGKRCFVVTPRYVGSLG